VGLDQSEPGRAAVEYAAEVANRRRLPLRLVLAFELPQSAVQLSDMGWGDDAEGVMRDSARRFLEETTECLRGNTPMLQRAAACKTAPPRRRSSKSRSMQICS
jgi:hypothetical protein